MSEKQEDLFGVPYVKGSDTSKEAAESMSPHVGRIANLVLGYIVRQGIRGATCDEIEVELNLIHQTASARVNELAKRGMIVDRGYRRPTRSGRRATVWEAKATKPLGI